MRDDTENGDGRDGGWVPVDFERGALLRESAWRMGMTHVDVGRVEVETGLSAANLRVEHLVTAYKNSVDVERRLHVESLERTLNSGLTPPD